MLEQTCFPITVRDPVQFAVRLKLMNGFREKKLRADRCKNEQTDRTDFIGPCSNAGVQDKESDETESQLDSNKPELRFRACSNTVCSVPEIHDGEDP